MVTINGLQIIVSALSNAPIDDSPLPSKRGTEPISHSHLVAFGGIWNRTSAYVVAAN